VNEFFGLSMTYIMIALLIVLGIALSTVGWVVVRNRVLFMIGVRNIPRRRAQTILIVIGLMLSTLIISTAFSIGDTIDYSVTSQVYDRMHSIDELVQARVSDSAEDPFAATSLVSAKPIPAGSANDLVDRFSKTDGVDGAVALIRAPVPVDNTRAGLREPTVVLVGADPAHMSGFESDLETTDGRRVSLDDLGHDEIYANQSTADKLDVQKGDQLQIFVGGQPNSFTVREIVQDRVLTGSVLGVTRGLALSLARAQELFKRPNEVDVIAISNDGGVRSGIDGSQRVKDLLNAQLKGTQWEATSTKLDLVDNAHQTASFLTTFFVILGLFSIAAGMMLIFLIFVMLAAERKVEMGMVRAVGTKRRHLVQIFMSEGMAYNTMAAAVGCALGIAVSLAMVRVMAALFAAFDLSIVFHVTPRSLIVSYSLGVVLTFLTVTFSSWRIGNLNIVSAIRDTPEPIPLRVGPEVRPGIGRILAYVRWISVKPNGSMAWLISLGILALAPAQVVLTIVSFVLASAMYGSSPVASVLAVLLGTAGICFVVGAVFTALFALNRMFQIGFIAAILGVLLIAVGLLTWRAEAYTAGVSLVIMGGALTLVMLRFSSRAVFTTMGLTLLAYWLLSAGGRIPPHLDGSVGMFFLSGITLVVAGTFVLVYNADVMLGVLTRAGSVFSHLVPSIRTAVAYPLANKFRTGMTVAMISLVMFALVMISTMNTNFSRQFLGDDALGGYDVIASENPNNHVDNLTAAIRDSGGDDTPIAAVDDVRLANRRSAEVRMKPQPTETGDKFARYAVLGPTTAFIRDNNIKFQARALGLDSDQAVWSRLATDPNAAVIDDFALGGGGFGGGGFELSGVKESDKTFQPVTVQVRDATNPGTVRDVTVIGIISLKASAIFNGLYIAPTAFDALFPHPESSAHYVKLNPGVDANREAKNIERVLLNQGVQADSLRQQIDDQQAQSRGFLYLVQGFMGIGLFVGIAAVGVIAFRTVVERRQQIGMLRAIGYTRNAIAISFIMESSFITLLGILSGIALGLLLAYQLLTSADFAPNRTGAFYVPWLQIAAIGAFAFIASLLMTIIPSRQASSIPIAEALRYE
jgi:putative ABC transport system permease protein